MARLIGRNRREAIDWAQDKLLTTRPIAEEVVSTMLEDRAAIIGDSGFILFESDNEVEGRMAKARASFDMKAMKKFRFHAIRNNKSRQTKAKKIAFDWNNANAAAQDMVNKEENK